MAIKYELWNRSDYQQHWGKSKPISTFYTLDLAVEEAKTLSKKLGKKVQKIYNWVSNADEELEVSELVLVVETGGAISRVRGVGNCGFFHYAKACNRCKNSGVSPQNYLELCRACSGASIGWKP